MKSIYGSPLRVYLCLGVLALVGIYAGTQLPVSLFPKSAKPIILVSIPYGDNSVDEFVQKHGNRLESQLRAISIDTAEVDKTRSFYEPEQVRFEVEFKWGSQPRSALREVESVVHSYASQFDEVVRNSIRLAPDDKDSGFFVASYSSPTRSLDELYALIEPLIMPQLLQIKDAAKPTFWNPAEKEVRIELDGERMSAFQLLPKDIEFAVKSALTASNGGTITVGLKQITVQLPRIVHGVEDFNQVLISTPGKQAIHLSDVAKISYSLKTLNSWSFKTNGAPSLIVFARPRPGGNIKQMSEDIIAAMKEIQRSLPEEIEYKVLVDPSQFIRDAVKNVFSEVGVGAFLAVLILFIFIGSFKNTVTAAIEIPLSMVLAFIPMKFSGMSINLISLGGLALSAGMNVDASVVVMENIFRHFDGGEHQTRESRLVTLVRAVNEVKFAIISSTIASLVVFLPLAFTSDLTYAILGDLAKAVVFSHGFSAFVALILVPTVRLQLMERGSAGIKVLPHRVTQSRVQAEIDRLVNFYVQLLQSFIKSLKFQTLLYVGLVFLLGILCAYVIPGLPKEVIGKPDTEDLRINLYAQGNTDIKQMEAMTDEVDKSVMLRFGDRIAYTCLNSYNPNQSWLLGRLKNKSEMRAIQAEMQNYFSNSPTLRYEINPFNPAELPIPDPPDFRLVVRGWNLNHRAEVARDLYQLLEENQIFPRLWSNPSVTRVENVVLQPHLNLWSNLRSQGSQVVPNDVADLVRVMTTGRKIGEVLLGDFPKDVFLRYSAYTRMNVEEIGAIPIGVGKDLIPLKALSRVSLMDGPPAIYQENQRDLVLISGKMNQGDSSHLTQERIQKAKKLIEVWKSQQNMSDRTGENATTLVAIENAGKEVDEAMSQLLCVVLLSVGLIFLVLMLQFGDIIDALLVLVAIPLGLIGVLISLFVFQSTLSLNSILGVILLNGIAVANSIILVDFIKRRVQEGLTPAAAALDAAKNRLRPILITSLTTILGMLPVAFGLGDGGRTLQPLGIAVSGGLWVSMGLTLFIVPALQVRYMNWKAR